MNDPLLTRRYVREVLALAPTRELTERMLLDAVSRLSRERLKVDELKQAIVWNESRGYLTSRHDDEAEEDLYIISPHGLRKEGYGTSEGAK